MIQQLIILRLKRKVEKAERISPTKVQIYANLPAALSTERVNFLIEDVGTPGNIPPSPTVTASNGGYNAGEYLYIF